MEGRYTENQQEGPLTMVGMFCGTSVPYKGSCLVETKTIGKGISAPDDETVDTKRRTGWDKSFEAIEQCIDHDNKNNVTVYGYDGCGIRGSTISSLVFGFNTDQPARHFISQLRNAVQKDPNRVINATLIGHSRGTFSIFEIAKQVNEDPFLKKAALDGKLNLFFQIRDPVSGNFDLTAEVDRLGVSLAGAYKNLSGYSAIQAVDLTIMHSVGEDSSSIVHQVTHPLIPEFSTNTKLSVECLPGGHNAVTNIDNLCGLGCFLKSLQLLIENGCPMNYKGMLKTLKENSLIKKIKIFPMAPNISLTNPAQALALLKLLQIESYQFLRDQTKTVDIQTRKLILGGEFGPGYLESDYLNPRHAMLAGDPFVKTRMEYKGDRPDLTMLQFQINLEGILQKPDFDLESIRNTVQAENFGKEYAEGKSIFTRSKGQQRLGKFKSDLQSARDDGDKKQALYALLTEGHGKDLKSLRYLVVSTLTEWIAKNDKEAEFMVDKFVAEMEKVYQPPVPVTPTNQMDLP